MTIAHAPTLAVLQDGTPLFTSHGTWLYPLFALEAYRAAHALQPAYLTLQDTSIGKAAALLFLRMGLHTVKAGVLSRRGEAILQRHGIAYSYEQLVERFHCQTEELLATVEDPEAAYQLVKARAGR
jgi:Domain of unknown function (DUF1893)